MRFSTVAVALASAVVVSAADIQVTVGDGGLLAFNPTSVTAAVGDTIHFEFRAKNHTVTQSTFASPCKIMTTPKQGIDSGFQPVAAGATQFPSWSFTVDNATNPLWFYCRQATHCVSGMVFAVNPTADKTFAAFQAAAMASSSSATTSSAGGAYPTTTSPSTSSGAPATTTSPSSGALRMSGSAAGVLAIVGLVAGLAL